jgi:hypothetical protein
MTMLILSGGTWCEDMSRYASRPDKVLELISTLIPADLFQVFPSPTVADSGRFAPTFASDHCASVALSGMQPLTRYVEPYSAS